MAPAAVENAALLTIVASEARYPGLTKPVSDEKYREEVARAEAFLYIISVWRILTRFFPAKMCARGGVEKGAGWLLAGASQPLMSSLPGPCTPAAFGTHSGRLPRPDSLTSSSVPVAIFARGSKMWELVKAQE